MLSSLAMRMRLAVNYSPQASKLVQDRRLQVGLFKCPDIQEYVAQAASLLPTYVHFGLRAGLRESRGRCSSVRPDHETQGDHQVRLSDPAAHDLLSTRRDQAKGSVAVGQPPSMVCSAIPQHDKAKP